MAVGNNELMLELGKHFLIIDSQKSFILEDNQGFSAYRPAGAWQIDCWKLLPEQWHKIYPVYTLKIVWVNSEADKDYIPTINATDLDLGDGIAGVSGQPVNITTPVEVANLPNVIVGEQNTVPVHIETNLQPLEVVNYANNIIDGFHVIKDSNAISSLFSGEKKIYIKSGAVRFAFNASVTKTYYLKDCVGAVSVNSGQSILEIVGFYKEVSQYGIEVPFNEFSYGSCSFVSSRLLEFYGLTMYKEFD